MDDEGFDASIDDVTALMHEDFSAEEQKRVWELLKSIEAAVPGHSVRRIQVAALMLAQGDRSEFERQAETAVIDYRDVLAPAFYPEE